VVQGVETKTRRLLRFRVQRRLELLNLLGVGRLIANRHRSRAPSCVVHELRFLPSAGIARFPRYYEPLRHLDRPGLSLAGVLLRLLPPARLPLLNPTSIRDMPTPLPRRNRGVRWSFSFLRGGGLPEIQSRSASASFVSSLAHL